MFCPPQPRDPLIDGWIARHRDPLSFGLHIIGIPATVLGPMLLPLALMAWSLGIAFLGVGLFVGGYLIQFVGHALEGSDPGEVIWLKRKLGLPYVEIAPRRQSPQNAA